MLYFHVLMFCLVSDENILHHSQPKPNRVKFNYGLFQISTRIFHEIPCNRFGSWDFSPKTFAENDLPQPNGKNAVGSALSHGASKLAPKFVWLAPN